MKKIILGTDWWTDCDDAVALRLLARAHKNREIELLGIGVNACMEDSVASLEGFLNTEGVAGIPLGIDSAATDYGGEPPYQKRLTAYAKNLRSNGDAEDAVRLYRRILASADDKIEIAEIGFLQVVADLLKSGGDDISEKSGLELVSEKVSKFWVMAGKWTADGASEHNFCNNPRSRMGGKEFCELCPVPVTFLGFEVGHGVISGDLLDEDDELHRVLEDHGSKNGRHSWDPMLVLMALIGDEEAAGYDTVTGTASVKSEDGTNYFAVSDCGKHKFVIKKYANDYYRDRINRMI